MPIIDRIAEFAPDMTAWRHDFHAHPEIGFEEHRTGVIVSEKLESWGIAVTRGVGVTGLVGSLRVGNGHRTIGIRADMDALGMIEAGQPPYRSTNHGRMHGCGHDGHIATLLGAARYLAETHNFNGTVHFIFQPAEEGRGGARRMIEDGLFDRFPCDAVYGMHNDPSLPLGVAAIKSGVVMAASVRFWIEVQGGGGRASRPHETIDPIMIASSIVMSLQSIVSRRIDPTKSRVVSVTQFHAGSAGNVIPSDATLNGTIRALDQETYGHLCGWLEDICRATAAMHGATVTIRYEGQAPSTINAARPTAAIESAARQVFGPERVIADRVTDMTGEDFAEMALRTPGCFVFLGKADGLGGDRPLHHPSYDFNDALLPLGASLWAALVEDELRRD